MILLINIQPFQDKSAINCFKLGQNHRDAVIEWCESGSQILLYNIYLIQFIPPFIPTNYRSRNWNILLYLFVKWLNQNFNIK